MNISNQALHVDDRKEELPVRRIVKGIGFSAMALGLLAIFTGWLIDPTVSMEGGIKLISIERELLQTDFFFWGTVLFAAGLNGYFLHTDL